MKEKTNTTSETAILSAAETLFKANGFKGTTTTMIAAGAGVTHAMLHYYFRTKEQIFVRVLDGYLKRMHDEFRLSMDVKKGIIETVSDVTANLFDFMKAHQGEMKLLLEIAEHNPELLQKYKSGMMTMMSESLSKHELRLREAVKEGLISPVTMNDLISRIIMLVYAPFALLPLAGIALGTEPERLEVFLQEQKRLIVKTICDSLRA